MPGRPLRQQREAALAALTDTQALELARTILPGLRINAVRLLLVSCHAVLVARGTSTRPQLQQMLLTPASEQRAALAAITASDPDTARLVVATAATDPAVEAALGITRTPRQQRR